MYLVHEACIIQQARYPSFTRTQTDTQTDRQRHGCVRAYSTTSLRQSPPFGPRHLLARFHHPRCFRRKNVCGRRVGWTLVVPRTLFAYRRSVMTILATRQQRAFPHVAVLSKYHHGCSSIFYGRMLAILDHMAQGGGQRFQTVGPPTAVRLLLEQRTVARRVSYVLLWMAIL